MNAKRIAQITAVSFLLTFLIVFLFLGIKGIEFHELEFIEMLKFFITVPLLTSIFYIVLANKFDEFNKNLNKIVKQLDIEGEELSGEEKTLRQEIIELKKIIIKLEKDIKDLKKIRAKK